MSEYLSLIIATYNNKKPQHNAFNSFVLENKDILFDIYNQYSEDPPVWRKALRNY